MPALSALPMPTPSAVANIAQIGASAAARKNRPTEKASCTSCMATSQRRRSNRSAMTPAGMDSTSSGPSWANTSRPTTEALPVRE